jgi:hypothetical protein
MKIIGIVVINYGNVEILYPNLYNNRVWQAQHLCYLFPICGLPFGSRGEKAFVRSNGGFVVAMLVPPVLVLPVMVPPVLVDGALLGILC